MLPNLLTFAVGMFFAFLLFGIALSLFTLLLSTLCSWADDISFKDRTHDHPDSFRHNR